jgi:hypothetical protein
VYAFPSTLILNNRFALRLKRLQVRNRSIQTDISYDESSKAISFERGLVLTTRQNEELFHMNQSGPGFHMLPPHFFLIRIMDRRPCS